MSEPYYHRMLEVDEQGRTGICDVCGPVSAYLYPKQKIWVCGKKRHENRMVSDHGITRSTWEKKFKKQRRSCAICRRTEPTEKGWATDHDRTCCPGARSCEKCFRGILCSPCNVALGMVKDDVSVLRSAIRYLSR